VKKIFSVLPVLLFQSCCLLAQHIDKIEGLSLESPPFELKTGDFENLNSVNANWVAVIHMDLVHQIIHRYHSIASDSGGEKGLMEQQRW